MNKTARALRREASAVSDEYYDLLATYNRIFAASNGRDERLALIDADLDAMQSQRRRLLARARMLETNPAA